MIRFFLPVESGPAGGPMRLFVVFFWACNLRSPPSFLSDEVSLLIYVF